MFKKPRKLKAGDAMPAYVNPGACNACASLPQPLCEYICPSNLMALDLVRHKAFNREPDLCSECYACVKICPEEAIQVRGYADFVPLGAEVKPRMEGTEIAWQVKFRNGEVRNFRFPIRNVSSLPATPWPATPDPSLEVLKGPLLYGEPEALGVSRLPSLKA